MYKFPYNLKLKNVKNGDTLSSILSLYFYFDKTLSSIRG